MNQQPQQAGIFMGNGVLWQGFQKLATLPTYLMTSNDWANIFSLSLINWVGGMGRVGLEQALPRNMPNVRNMAVATYDGAVEHVKIKSSV
jgi:hypothetical protein